MNNKIFFAPGPSELYFTVKQHLKNALKEGIGSISHRGREFQDIFSMATTNLRSLLNLPEDYHILFTSSSNEIWERILQNCVDKKSYHLVNGAFSKKFHRFALDLGLEATKTEVPLGEGFEPVTISPSPEDELAAFIQNETSTGVCLPLEDIYACREKHPHPLFAVDVVSSIPYIDLDFNQVDTAYFSVQKCFGLPAGLGVWLVNERALEKAKALANHGHKIGTYHSLPSLVEQALANQTPETPNVLGIYLLSKVARDMLEKGIEAIRREIDYKAAVLYHALETSRNFTPFVTKERLRSKTVVVAKSMRPSGEIIEEISRSGPILGKGYGVNKENQIRIANFPTHSKEQVEKVADLLQKM